MGSGLLIASSWVSFTTSMSGAPTTASLVGDGRPRPPRSAPHGCGDVTGRLSHRVMGKGRERLVVGHGAPGPGGSRHGPSIARPRRRRGIAAAPRRVGRRRQRGERRRHAALPRPLRRRGLARATAGPPSPPPAARSARRTPPSAWPRSRPPTRPSSRTCGPRAPCKGAARDRSIGTARPGMGHKFADERLEEERAAARPHSGGPAVKPTPGHRRRSPATSGTWR